MEEGELEIEELKLRFALYFYAVIDLSRFFSPNIYRERNPRGMAHTERGMGDVL